MCGIFALFNNIEYNYNDIERWFLLGKARGPENSTLNHISTITSYLGFHRFAINGYNDEKAEQPFKIDNVYLYPNNYFNID